MLLLALEMKMRKKGSRPTAEMLVRDGAQDI